VAERVGLCNNNVSRGKKIIYGKKGGEQSKTWLGTHSGWSWEKVSTPQAEGKRGKKRSNFEKDRRNELEADPVDG